MSLYYIARLIASRLTGYIGKPTQINKPVFSIVDELILPNFLPLFRTGLGDPALLNATMLTLAFAITGTINQELLKYHNQALSSIREKLCSPEQAASESTLAAILLMAGMEVSNPSCSNSCSNFKTGTA